MISIELSPAVIRKLDLIHEYIASELNNQRSAHETIEKIINSFERLKLFPDSAPLMSALYTKVPDSFANIRVLVCGNYIAFYEFSDNIIRVLQLYHTSEDYVRYLIMN